MKKLWIEEIEEKDGIPAISWSVKAPEYGKYIDKSDDIIAWNTYGDFVLDLNQYRYIMKPLFYLLAGDRLQNWENLSSEVQEIGSKMFFVPYDLRLKVVGEEQDFRNWILLIQQTQGLPFSSYVGRAIIFEKMRYCVTNKVRVEKMAMVDSQQMLKDVGLMYDWFIRSNAQDLIQWITNERGSPYEKNGFAEKPYYNEDLKNELYEIYNGTTNEPPKTSKKL